MDEYFELLEMVGVALVGWFIGWVIARSGMGDKK